MIDAMSSATSVAVLASDAPNRTGAGLRSSLAASAGTHGVDPIAPATSASHNSGVRYHWIVNGVGRAGLIPAIASRNITAPRSVSARKNTQPTITTASVYTWGQMGHAAIPSAATRDDG